MNRASQGQIQHLKKYTKAEIIEALEHTFASGHVVADMLSYLSDMKMERTIAENKRLEQKEQDAFRKYIEWKRTVVAKYGDGHTIKIASIPTRELKAGAALEQEWLAARNALHASDEKMLSLN